jgi:hypothetical protein
MRGVVVLLLAALGKFCKQPAAGDLAGQLGWMLPKQ